MSRGARQMLVAALAALALALALTLAAGCSNKHADLCPCPDGKPLDEELMLVLGSARALHHQADIQLQHGELDRAIEAVRRILTLKLDARWPEAEEVRLDATARLAKLLLGKGDDGPALTLVDSAIASAPRESFYLSNLHSVRGEILEQRGKRLDGQGNKEGARQSARQAIAAFERSIAINKRLQQQLLPGGKR